MSRPASLIMRLSTVFMLLVALASTGWAHRVTPVPFDESLHVYLAAGGSLADICADHNNAGHAGQTCDACRLVDAMSVPPTAVAAIAWGQAGSATAYAIFDLRIATGCAHPAHPARAPPAV